MMILNNNLRIFMTAAELGSLTETAKKLYVSQPAISQAIRKLEDELGVKLFIRNKRGRLQLTNVGKEILSIAWRMSDLENRLYQAAYQENHLMGGIIRIASVPLGVSLYLAHILPAFKQQFPAVQVELLEGNPQEVKDMVLNYQVDLGISTSPYTDGLEHRIVANDQMVSISADKTQEIDLKKDSSNLILCRVAYDALEEQLSGQNIDLSHCIVVEAASTQINMIEAGNGRGVISQLMLSTIPNHLKCGNVLPKMEMEISLIANDFHSLSAAAEKMSEMILNVRQDVNVK